MQGDKQRYLNQAIHWKNFNPGYITNTLYLLIRLSIIRIEKYMTLLNCRDKQYIIQTVLVWRTYTIRTEDPVKPFLIQHFSNEFKHENVVLTWNFNSKYKNGSKIAENWREFQQKR
jgi:hypothetical protein